MTTYESYSAVGLTSFQVFQKRGFDLFFAVLGLALTWWLILLAWLAASMDARSNGFFVQSRIGLNGKIFRVVKIKTMRPIATFNTTVTSRGDPRITYLGALLRRTKIDELPQLWNVLIGEMSFVGPRPDVPGYADYLSGEDRVILSLRPGITGPASLKYKKEEELLACQADPVKYNDEVIWSDKVKINREYIENFSLMRDITYIWKTIIG